MPGLNEDTLADKVLRFVIGAFVGAATGFLWLRWTGTDPEFIRNILMFAGVFGLLAVLFGNRFLEEIISHRWWH